MSGFFPVMMFGLPAACLAMYRAARPDRRRAVGGLLFSMALTSFLTGVTEPVEFTFMFLAPVLYGIHAVLTGTAMVLMDVLGVRLGFGFSAGLFDYLLNFNIATRPFWLLPVGALYFLVYYLLFRFFILRLGLQTPGREAPEATGPRRPPPGGRVDALLEALGGSRNLASVDACTTRLRLVVHDRGSVRVDDLKALGAHGVVMVGPSAVQVVVGPTADRVAGELRAALGEEERPPLPAEAAPVDRAGDAVPHLERLTAAFGGPANVLGVEFLAGRVRVQVQDRADFDGQALPIGTRAVAWISPTVAHVLPPRPTSAGRAPEAAEDPPAGGSTFPGSGSR